MQVRGRSSTSDIVLVEEHGADSIAVVTLGEREVMGRVRPGAADMSATRARRFRVDGDGLPPLPPGHGCAPCLTGGAGEVFCVGLAIQDTIMTRSLRSRAQPVKVYARARRAKWAAGRPRRLPSRVARLGRHARRSRRVASATDATGACDYGTSFDGEGTSIRPGCAPSVTDFGRPAQRHPRGRQGRAA
jgi:hypothetical protein